MSLLYLRILPKWEYERGIMNFDVFLKVVLAVVETFAFFALGGFAVERKMFSADSLKGASRFAINVLTPFLVFSSIAGKFTREDLQTAWIYPVLGFLMIAFHAVCGRLLLPLLRNRTPERTATFMHMAAVNNFIYLPIIIIGYLFPGKTVAALLFCSVGSTFGQWTIGIAVMTGNDSKKLLKNLISPNSVAVLVAVLYLLLPWKLPAGILDFTVRLGNLAIPLCLILIGASIWVSRSKLTAYPADLFFTTAVRIVLIPLCTLLAVRWIPLPEIARNLALVLAVMPASSGSVLIVREYGGDVDFAGQLILSTTLLGLITMPVFLAWAL